MKRELRKARRSQDWSAWLMLYERPFRLMALLSLSRSRGLSAKQYWSLVRVAWTDTENLYQHTEQIRQLLYPRRIDAGKRYLIMNKDERGIFRKLPDPITVYRGCGAVNRLGWSWTTNRAQASWFADRHFVLSNVGLVLTATCPRSEALAYLNERGEDEIIADPAKLEITSERKVARKKGSRRNKAKEAVLRTMMSCNSFSQVG